MPKPTLKNVFARRKSSGNLLDSPINTDAPANSSFRVIERPEKTKIVLDGPDRRTSTVPRPFASPLENLRGKSVDDLTYSAGGAVDTAATRRSAGAKNARGSGGTTGSNSSEFYQSSAASARHSSSSTLPSSVEPEADAESDGELFASQWKAAAKKPLPDTPGAPLPMPPSFSARAQRAFSFGLSKKPIPETYTPKSPTVTSPTIPIKPTTSHSPTRERALTTSSYASTAVPIEKPDLKAADFGGIFGDMFEHLGQTRKDSPNISPPAHRTDSPPIFPPKSYSRQSYTPSPHGLRGVSAATDSPYSQTRRTSDDALLSSANNSPQLGRESQGFFGAKQEYAPLSNETSPNLSKQSSQEYMSAPATAGASQNPSQDNIKRYELHDAQDTPTAKSATSTRQSTIRFSSIPPLASIGQLSDDMEMVDITPKPVVSRRSVLLDDEPLFDAKPALRVHTMPLASEHVKQKRLTKAQFDILQKYPNKPSESAEKEDSGDEYDEEDEAERLKQVAHQRRRQEANMALYRQQMKKVTGGGPTDLPSRPPMERAPTSVPSLHIAGIPSAPPAESFKPKPQDEDEDDDVPLAILQAHGFPSSQRAPSQVFDQSPGYRPGSMARNSTVLPPFARRLPEDPYFGAGIVNSPSRESMAFAGAGSAYGPASQPGTPGGLVGIIATEERQRQARRGSPNPQTGTYNAPLPANMPNLNRTSSMPMMAPGMPMMMPMPATDNAQLQQFMQQQMVMMQNMQNMIQMQQAQINNQMSPQAMSPQAISPMQPGLPRPASMASNMPSMSGTLGQGRTMSMLGTPSTWNLGAAQPRPLTTFDPRMSTYAPSVNGLSLPAGYTPSIAPSERSNVGQPSRYRPVTSAGEGDRRQSMMSSQSLNAFRSSQNLSPLERPASQHLDRPKSTIRLIEKTKSAPRAANVENDDDDEGSWADMVKKRLKGRKSRASKAAEERVPLGELYINAEHA